MSTAHDDGFAPLAERTLDANVAPHVDASALGALARAVGPLALVDLETTGLSDDAGAEILEVGLVLIDPPAGSLAAATEGDVPGSSRETRLRLLESLVQPRARIPRGIVRLTGIDDEMVADAPTIEQLAPALERALAGRTIVAHNAEFERSFLSRCVSGSLAQARYLDTQDLVALVHPDAPDLRLETFTRALFGREERHRALADALDTACVMSRVARGAREGEARHAVAREAIERFAPEAPWAALLAEVKQEVTSEPRVRERGAQLEVRPEFAPRETRVPFDEEAIVAALSDEARGRRHFSGYRVRAEQLRLVRAIVGSLRDGGRLLVEGGTGVGKSLAYLAAAIPFAMERANAGERGPVIVSTRTKLLQDQLLRHDVPATAALLGWPELRVVSIKGRASYACARRLELALAGSQGLVFAEDRLARAALWSCAHVRPDGELAGVPIAMRRRFPPLHGLLHQSVAARAEQCSREQCAQRGEICPFGRKRAALARAQLAVTNHDLLLRWPPDYPAFAHAIVDEAHELAGVTDEVLAQEVAPEEVLDRLDEVFGRPSEKRAAASLLRAKDRRALSRDATAWRRAIQQDLIALGRTLGQRGGEWGELQLPLLPGPELDEAATLAATIAKRLELVAGAIDDLAGAGERDDTERTALARAAADLRSAGNVLRTALEGAGEDAVASFEGLVSPWDRWRCKLRPVSPAGEFHERFLDRTESFVATSASLFIGGNAAASMGELEIEERGRDRVARASAASPFPYPTHMRVVAMDTPERAVVEETAAVLADVARRLGGRTLGLFTSLRRMREAADLLADLLRGDGMEVLAPRRAYEDPAALVERFRRGGAVLLGSRTYWQGLDLPGEVLQAVVIEKLPFEVPTELRRRREERLRRDGFDPFTRSSLGKMLLNLKQMVGRLIRSETDRGIVVIVDGRPGKGYFRRLKDALPEGCSVRVVKRSDLPTVLQEVGL